MENKQTIKFIDSTPNDGYIIRILEAYLADCNTKFSTKGTSLETGDDDNDPFCKMMNDLNLQRSKLLKESLDVLLKYYAGKGISVYTPFTCPTQTSEPNFTITTSDGVIHDNPVYKYEK